MSSSLGNTQLLVGRAGGYSSNYTADISGSLYCASGCVLAASGGYVGIGTTSPTQLLDISASGTNPVLLMIRSNGTDSQIGLFNGASGARNWYVGSGSSASGAGPNFYIYDAAASTTRFAINSSGNVGIGTTNPQSALDVTGAIRVSGGITPVYATPSFSSGQIGSVISAGSYSTTPGLTTTNTWYRVTDVTTVPAGVYIVNSVLYCYSSSYPVKVITQTGYSSSTSTTGVTVLTPNLLGFSLPSTNTGASCAGYIDILSTGGGNFYFFFYAGMDVNQVSTTMNTGGCRVILTRIA